jgi:glycosyltransferase involved in cell wall biosynthesis
VGDTLRVEDGVPRRRVAVVPNFVEEEAFADAFPAPGRAAYGIPDGAPVIGIVARLREEKDHLLLLAAMALVRRRCPAAHLLVVGDGPEHAALEARADALGIRDAVTFVGHLPNRPNPHRLFDVSVLCSRHEGFPNTVIEAMAAARPVVATAVGGIPDAVRHGETGLLVRPGDADGLAAAIGALLEDPARAAALGEAGRHVARAEFHVDVVIPGLVALYRHILRERGAAPTSAA